MLAIIEFAIASARRQAELCRLEWADNDAATRTGLVRDAKHPRHKDGNHRGFKYTPEAWAVVDAQPRGPDHIFPYEPKSVGTAFTRACHLLGIRDLRFHDLRHEATSRLFERGYQIHEVALFTLHDSWNELKRYTSLKPENLRELGSGTAAQATDSTTTGAAPAARRVRHPRTLSQPGRAARRSTPPGLPH